MMKKFIQTKVGRLRLIGLLEGISLLVLVFVAVPLKYGWQHTELSAALGPIHGALFLLFIFNTLSVGTEQGWRFRQTTWKVLLACMVPFGTFYIDRHILRHLHTPSS